MSQCFTVILMLLSMLSHTLLGCGWHHAHECHSGEIDSCHSIAVCEHTDEHAHHDHPSHDQHTERSSEESPNPQESDPCQEGRCSYLVSTPAKILEETPWVVDLLPGLDLLSVSQDKQYSHTMIEISCISSSSAPGVRAQVLTTVWLL